MLDFTTAEYSVIGCILIDARCLPAVRQRLVSAGAFANDACRRAYEAACTLFDEDKDVDPVTVGHLAGLEGNFMRQCMELAPSCTRAETYAQAVLEGFQRRQLQELGAKLQEGAMARECSADRLLSQALEELEQLADAPGRCCVRSARESLLDFLTYRAEVKEGVRKSIQTGFPGLDNILGGLAQGGLYIMAARPGVGKSALGIALADMMAKNYNVLYVSLEMTEQELNARRVAAVAETSCTFGTLLFGTTSEKDDTEVINACGKLYERRLLLSAVSAMTVPVLEIQARNTGAEVVMVDYLGLLSSENRRLNEYERITQISGDLKRMAKRLRCVVLALCQLNRESVSTSGADTRPRLSQLRSSGAIEQDADGVLLLHRPEYGQPDKKRDPAAPQQFFVDIAKNRHGRTGTAELSWYPPDKPF